MLATAIAGVVDLDRVQDVVGKLIEVRPAVGGLERDVVGNDRYGAGDIRADKSVEVGRICRRVLGNLRRFTMRRQNSPSRGEKGARYRKRCVQRSLGD